ncbi:YqfQ family protein [Allobacillus halotolerans]|uniref:YqfQ family protein n=1 Tax=Allobacillus halotolerans TaxID=570278 RepID=A0ABS6GLE9_9BACI|nr:YqfQ family protein [Allobacillus halotolerans]MBU6079460.1 YqfQ family protein [Allobacillus halotolerans]
MYPFNFYQQPPAQKPPFLQQVLNYLPAKAQDVPPYAMPPNAGLAPYSQTSSLVNSITKVHKGLQVVQQVLPIWKQYAPLIKNAPMLIDMAKIMLTEESEDQEEESLTEDQEDGGSIQAADSGDKQLQKQPDTTDHKNEIDGIPGPKLYI